MNAQLKFDFHTHHYRCGHARGDIRNYIEAAIDKGLDMIGISDHSPYFAREEEQAYPSIAMGKSEFDHYISEVLKLKEEYKGKIDVLLGVESDFFPEYIHIYREQYKKYAFDYIIGSVHQVNGISIFNKNHWENLSVSEKIETKESYYTLIAESAKSGLFQILGHIDALKAFYPSFSSVQTDAVDRALQVIGECNVAIEINTSGKMKDCGGWYPADDILERALRYGVKVTFGSDAHDPERVGDEFEVVGKRLKEIGFKEWAYFKEQQMFLSPL
ncbi:histidinol-phosphatase [Lederbergia lenta]|uniref:Histidinol-phosphatase n=1 Tax=Lederbergia lenta TaxID=1467 RepID=A0A2X4YYF9_LEDLE|nr:histidinol-phosphatase [Lederbergia lenta]MCM3113211.1 histidinol-phosphatase [Lederbergia lenta]MEC2326000.1 histidinol-phosphatase [Lederbergia lenta]SQI53384.1 histidinol phosphate phosphatase HisJ family protein [Lederbergia lenta]